MKNLLFVMALIVFLGLLAFFSVGQWSGNNVALDSDTTNMDEHKRVVSQELSKGETHNDILLNFKLGMTKSEYEKALYQAKKQGKIYKNDIGENVYPLFFDDKSITNKAEAWLYPNYYQGKLYQLILFVESKDEVSTLEALKVDLFGLFKEKYNDSEVVIKTNEELNQDIYYLINGNREIVVSQNDYEAIVAYTNLRLKAEVQKARELKKDKKSKETQQDI